MRTFRQRPARTNVAVQVVEHLNFAVAPWAWPFAQARRAEIQGFFGRLDPSTTLRRELLEETGIAADEFAVAPQWYAVRDEPLLPLVKIMRSAAPAKQLRQRIWANLASQRDPEFCRIVAVRRLADLSEQMPRRVRAFLQHVWETAVPAAVSPVAGAAR